jgi:hypothetical protein
MTTAHDRDTLTPPAPVGLAPDRARHALVVAPLIAGALTIAALMVVVPWGERNELGYQAWRRSATRSGSGCSRTPWRWWLSVSGWPRSSQV